MEQEIKVGDWVHVSRAGDWSTHLEQITEICVGSMHPYRNVTGHYKHVKRPSVPVVFDVPPPTKESFENRELSINEALQWVELYDPHALDVCYNTADCSNVHHLSFLTKNAVFTINPRAFLKAGDPVFYRLRKEDPYELGAYCQRVEHPTTDVHIVYTRYFGDKRYAEVKVPTAQELSDYINLHGVECYEITLGIKK